MTLNELKSRLSIGHWYLVGIVIIAIAAVAWWLFLPSKTVTGTYATATVSGAVKGLPTTAVQLPKGIQAYQHKAIETLGLTDFIKNEMVLSAVEIKSDPHPTTSVCLVDPDTGKVRAVNKIEPYKWLAAENRREVGIYTGFRGSDRGDMDYRDLELAIHKRI